MPAMPVHTPSAHAKPLCNMYMLDGGLKWEIKTKATTRDREKEVSYQFLQVDAGYSRILGSNLGNNPNSRYAVQAKLIIS